jgi:hypothetical protein
VRWSEIGAAALLAAACTSAPTPPGRAPDAGRSRDAGRLLDAPAVNTPPAPRAPDGAPAARLTLSTTDLDVGTINIGAQGTGVVVVTNVGDLPSAPLAASLAAAADFQATHNCARRLGIGETCVVTVRFSPTTVGAKTTTGQVSQTEGDTRPLTFNARATGRLAPDAGPDAAREAGADAPPRDATPTSDARPAGG